MSIKLLRKLCQQDFPDCTRDALQYLVSCCSSGGNIPGLGGGANSAVEVAQEFIIFTHSRGGTLKRLSAIQELQLLEMISSCIQNISEQSRYAIFTFMFGGQQEKAKIALLIKLVSLAMSLKYTPVLDCAALWMQQFGCSSPAVCSLAHSLVQEYCMLFQDASQVFLSLPQVCPSFACNIITAVTSFYSFKDLLTIPPDVVVEHITDWIVNDPSLCTIHATQSDSHKGSASMFKSRHSPIPGLSAWCIVGPISYSKMNAIQNKNMSSKNGVHFYRQISKLHLGLLQSLTANRGHVVDLLLECDVENLVHRLADVNILSEAEHEIYQESLERLGQILQVSLVTKAYQINRGKLKKLISMLPRNRLLELVCKSADDPQMI